MRHFLLRWLLPALVTLSLAGACVAVTARTSDLPSIVVAMKPVLAAWLLFAALWCTLLWIILLPSQRAIPRNQQHRQRQYHTDYRQPRRTASRR